MKKAQKKYDLSLKSKNVLKVERCNRAAARSETYAFSGVYDDLTLSYELKGNLAFKQDFYSRSAYGKSLWSDRSSAIGAPFGSEMFLQNERGMPEAMFGGPRFYFNDFDDRDNVPDARSKFPYDRVAHESAKTIARAFRFALDRKNRAAAIIQRNMKIYIGKVSRREEVKFWQECVSLIQQTYLKNKTNLRKNSIRRQAQLSNAAAEIQLRAQLIALRREEEKEERRKAFMFICVTRMARNFIHRRRKARAAAKRAMIYARRLQAKFRGRKERRMLKKLYDARIFIIYWWRKHWKKKYWKYAIMIQRAYRRQKLIKAVITLQRIVRGKLGQHLTARKRLEIVAMERARANREFIVIERNMKEVSLDLSWMGDDEQVPPITMSDHMRRLDVYCLAVLTANPLQLSDEEYKTIHPAEFGEDDYADDYTRLHSLPSDSLEQRIVKAVLNLFANRPGGCLDRAALLVCRDLLRPCKASGLSVTAWDNMTKYPMINIASLSMVLEPSKALLFRVRINGRGRYLPPSVLAKAVLVNRWTMHYEWIVRQQIVKFRKLFPPRRVCKFCLEPLMSDGDVYDNRRCCRNGYFSWLQKALESTVQVLVRECDGIDVPSMPRPWMKDNAKLAFALTQTGPLGATVPPVRDDAVSDDGDGSLTDSAGAVGKEDDLSLVASEKPGKNEQFGVSIVSSKSEKSAKSTKTGEYITGKGSSKSDKFSVKE